MKFNLCIYTDVYGDRRNGYEVNNLSNCGEVDIPDSWGDKAILEYLRDSGYIITSDMRRVYIRDWGDLLEIIQRKDDFPIGHMMLVYD